MTDDRSLERAARSFIEDGPTQAPDRAVEAALLRIETTPQERDLRIPWRFPSMTTPARLAVAALVGVLLVGGGFYFFGMPGQPAVGVPGPSAGATAQASPISSSAPARSPIVRPDYTGLEGWVVFEHFGQAPDGTTTAFDPDLRQIWLIHADGTGLHELAPGLPVEGKFAPDISPDGTKVIFSTWSPNPQIWEVGIEGGDPRLVSTDCSRLEAGCYEFEPAYSPDGRRVAFIRGADIPGGAPTEVAIRDLTTGIVTLLASTRSNAEEGIASQPSWSPDGSQIAFSRLWRNAADEPVDSRLYSVGSDDKGLRELPLPAGQPWGDPDWSPDGTRLVFSSGAIHDFNGTPEVNVYSARPDGTDLQQLTFSDCGGCGAPSWTPDGAHILFWGPTTFWMMEPDGSNQWPINSAKLTFFGDRLGYGYYAYLQPTP